MFGRIMAVVVAVIVLLTSVLSGLGLYTLTSRQTAIRQENLRAEAREIAYLASLYSGGSSTYTLGTSLFSGSAQNTVALKHLRWKAAQVYDEYGAYIAIVDRSGQVMDNMAVTYEKNPDFAKTLNGKDIYEALLTIIGGDAFVGCTSLTSMTIPDSVTEIGANPFPRSGLQSITLSLDNPTFAVVDGALVRKADNTLLSYFCGRQDAAYTIPQGILAIGDNAFAYVDSLQSITIPDSVTSIGHSAFLFCRGLTDVTIPDSVTSIGNSAFSGCSSLATVTLPASISEISDHLFFACDVLSSVNIPDSVTRIGESAFASCDQLHTIDIPDSVTIIDHGAFQLSGITSVSIPNSVTTIGNGAFSYCDTLTDVTLPGSLTEIGYMTFAHSLSLTSITIPASVTFIDNDAFKYHNSLTLTVTPDFYAEEYAKARKIDYTYPD